MQQADFISKTVLITHTDFMPGPVLIGGSDFIACAVLIGGSDFMPGPVLLSPADSMRLNRLQPKRFLVGWRNVIRVMQDRERKRARG